MGWMGWDISWTTTTTRAPAVLKTQINTQYTNTVSVKVPDRPTCVIGNGMRTLKSMHYESRIGLDKIKKSSTKFTCDC